MGCNIKWTGKRTITILGVKSLKETNYKVMFDRIEAGTYMIASVLMNGNLKIKNINPKVIKTEIDTLKKIGADVKIKDNELIIVGKNRINNIKLTTAPYPGFPTDLQAQLMVLLCKGKGRSIIIEKIFENRFMHASELNRMGAKIKVSGNLSTINFSEELNGAEVMATDLRASVSLVLAGLIAKNRTILNRVYHLDRGYENLEKKLRNCGAKIIRVNN